MMYKYNVYLSVQKEVYKSTMFLSMSETFSCGLGCISTSTAQNLKDKPDKHG